MKLLGDLKEKFLLSPRKIGGHNLPGLLRQAMAEKKKVFLSSVIVPDKYELLLPEDAYKEIGVFLPSLQQELVELLSELAAKQGAAFLQEPPIVLIIKGGKSQRQKALVKASFSSVVSAEQEAVEKAEGLPGGEGEMSFQVRLLFQAGDSKEPDTFTLVPGIYVLGRGSEVDVRLDPGDQLVSRRHCLLTVGENQVEVEDLQSSNGTLVNGRRLSEPVTLSSGDILQLGGTRIEVLW